MVEHINIPILETQQEPLHLQVVGRVDMVQVTPVVTPTSDITVQNIRVNIVQITVMEEIQVMLVQTTLTL